MKIKCVTIDTPFIRLDDLLKYVGEAATGGQAKVMIQGGLVSLNGEVCTQRGKKLVPGDRAGLTDGQVLYEVAAATGTR